MSSAFEARMDAVPALGAHSASIQREIGYSDAAIAQLATASGED